MKTSFFQHVADTAGFILVYPQATDPFGSGNYIWNDGTDRGGNADDAGFIVTLLNTVKSHYNVDQTKVYATGFSIGGFFSHYVACNLSE